MKKVIRRITIILLVLSIVFIPIDICAKNNEYYIYTGITNNITVVYEKPTMGSNIVGTLKQGTQLRIYKEVVNWDEQFSFKVIKYNGKWGYVPYYDILNTDLSYRKRVNSSEIQAYPFISLEGNIIDNSYKELLNTYLLLPNYIRSMFQIEGNIIRMTEQDVQWEAYGKEGYKPGGLKAAYDYEIKKLFINDENPRDLVHEMGHYVNDRLNMFSNRPENKKLFETEGKKVSLYAINGANEYYAECFDMYFRCPTLLMELSPESYSMIERSLTEFYNLASTLLPEELL